MVPKTANRVRELREARKISGIKLAEMLGISPQYLYDLEKGERRLNEELIARLAAVFRVSADYVLGLTDEQRPSPPHADLPEAIAAHRDDDPMADLPEPARKSVDDFIAYIRQKYSKMNN